MRRVHLATRRAGKVRVLQSVLKEFGIEVVQEEIDTESPTEGSVEEVATFKVRQAFELLHKPVIAHGVAFCITALHDWPGISIDRVLRNGGTEEILRRLEGKERHCEFRYTLAYLDEQLAAPVLFSNTRTGLVADKLRGEPRAQEWSMTGRIFIPLGETRTFSEMNEEEFHLGWRVPAHGPYAAAFARWLQENR
ncbi:MAG: non-canonical purine NTP pyrophosphatase [Candidatus Andersenbacteria bacterium]